MKWYISHSKIEICLHIPLCNHLSEAEDAHARLQHNKSSKKHCRKKKQLNEALFMKKPVKDNFILRKYQAKQYYF